MDSQNSRNTENIETLPNLRKHETGGHVYDTRDNEYADERADSTVTPKSRKSLTHSSTQKQFRN